MNAPTPPIRLIVFTAPWCGVCQALKRSRAVNQFSAANGSKFAVQIHECPDDPATEDPIADAYGAKSLPYFVFEDTETGAELLTKDGGLSIVMLNELAERAKAIYAGEVRAKRGAPTREGGYPAIAAKHEESEAET